MKIRCDQFLAFVCFMVLQSVQSLYAQESFEVWLDDIKLQAIQTGISKKTAEDAVAHIAFLPQVIALDHAQPEFIYPFLSYYYQRVDAAKIQKGRALLSQHAALLDKVEAQYGVPKSLLVAFWGMETHFGTHQGRVDTLSALATLAYEGRRAEFFRGQLLDAIRIIDAGHMQLANFHGSWAGAFGNMQFMPTTFMIYAVDGDGDGKVDVVKSLPDAFSSAANYLSKIGWRHAMPAMIEVQLPENFNWQEAQLTYKKPIKTWALQGVQAIVADVAIADAPVKTLKKAQRKASAKKPAVATEQLPEPTQKISTTALPELEGEAAIVLPQGWQGPAFMVFDNFDVIMDWNRSVNYALSVAQFAKRLNQEGRIVGGKQAQMAALSFQQMLDLQAALNANGFKVGTPDGFPGLKTQAAVRQYQQAVQLPADGYPSLSIYKQLVSE